MLQQFLNALVARTATPTVSAPRPVEVQQVIAILPLAVAEAQPPVRSYPRSVCTSLKDLCEL